ncbi:MAG: signal peptide peptidase SppA [Deltaproteobacteria bacterium]|nr:signal peptide peptidase SppA [Deltaproteobacteria bacterium]
MTKPNPPRRALTLAVTAAALLLSAGPAGAQNWTFLDGPKADAKVSPVRVFRLMGQVTEAPAAFSLFASGSGVVFPELIAALDRESRRPEVKALAIRLGTDLGIAQGEELAAAIARARDRKKEVVVHLESASTGQLLAVRTADTIAMTPEGSLFLTGLRAEVSFYKDLLATLGIRADIEAVGKYKSAAEPYRLTTMSDAAKEQLESLLDSLYASVVRGVASPARKVSEDDVRRLVDVGLFTADEAKKAHLVDETAYWPALRESLAKRYGELSLAYPVPDDVPDLSSIFSVIELLTKSPSDATSDRPRVALVTLEGPIVSGAGGGGLFGAEAAVASDDVVATLEALAKDPQVKAVVLRVDSPGGSALASDVIWRAVAQLAETRPVVASLGDVAASGGYYVASAAKRILASDATLTGSIGVFGGKMVIGELLDKIGVHTVVLSRGKHAGMMSSLSGFSDSERAVFRGHMEHTYQTFVNRVRSGRGMSYDAVDKIAQGRVWTGEQARGVGLVDSVGGLYNAVVEAAKAAKLDVAAVDVVRYPKARSLLEMLEGDPQRLLAPRLDVAGGVLAALPEPLRTRAQAAATLLSRLWAKEQVLAMMPFELSLR